MYLALMEAKLHLVVDFDFLAWTYTLKSIQVNKICTRRHNVHTYIHTHIMCVCVCFEGFFCHKHCEMCLFTDISN